MTAERGGRTLAVWTFVNPRGTELLWADGAITTCAVAPDRPAVSPCVSGSGPQGWMVAGRVGDDVAAVSAEYVGGGRERVAVANGYFALLGDRDVRLARLVARDAAGATVGTLENGAPGTVPIGAITP